MLFRRPAPPRLVSTSASQALPTRRRLREVGRCSTLTLIRSGLLTRKDMESAFVLPHAARERTGNLRAQERVTASPPAPGGARPGPSSPRPGEPYRSAAGRPAPPEPRGCPAGEQPSPGPLTRFLTLRPPLTGRRRCASDASTPRDAGAGRSRRVCDVGGSRAHERREAAGAMLALSESGRGSAPAARSSGTGEGARPARGAAAVPAVPNPPSPPAPARTRGEAPSRSYGPSPPATAALTGSSSRLERLASTNIAAEITPATPC